MLKLWPTSSARAWSSPASTWERSPSIPVTTVGKRTAQLCTPRRWPAFTEACGLLGSSARREFARREFARREFGGHRADDVAEYIFSRLRSGNRFAKSSDNSGVDASLLWLAVPFGVVSGRDPAMAATAAEIALSLDLDGGTRRYAADTYYGGGAWPLLTAWLGWYRCSTGDLEGARRCVTWVEACFDAAGRLPEQVGGESRDAPAYRAWVGRWARQRPIWRGHTPCTSSCRTN